MADQSPNPTLSPTPSPTASPRGRADRWRGGRGSNSEDTPRSFRDMLAGESEARHTEAPESSHARRVVRSMVRREEESTAIDELDDSEDQLDDEEEAPWEEPAHVTRKRARGRRGGKKVTRAAHPERDAGAYADFDGLCLLCTQPGHRAADCITGPVCLRCGEVGHMARECSLPRPPRPASPPGGDEPARKRLNDDGRGRRMGEGAVAVRARAPEGRQAAGMRHREVAPAPRDVGGERRVVRRVDAAGRSDAGPRRGAAPRQDGAPPRMNREAAYGRREGQGADVVRTVAPVPVRAVRAAPGSADRAIDPVLPAARRVVEEGRPRRSAEEQVIPLGLRAPAVGGELARRPTRAVCILPHTPEMDEAEEALSKALLAVIVGVRRTVSTEEVAMALEDVHGLAPGSFSVHCHRPEDFLIFFAVREDRDRVLGDGVLTSPFFRLLLRPWSRRTHAASGGLCVHTELEVEGIPANAWTLATAEAILASAVWVERLHPLTRSRRSTFTSWNPMIPSLADMAAPSLAIVPSHVNTLVYPVLVHVTSTVDFRRATPGGAAAAGGDGGRTDAWPTRRQYQYTRGMPDVLPGSGGDGGAAPSSSQAGGSGGRSTRTLTSGAVVADLDHATRQGKRRRRGGRKIRALRAKALAAAQSADKAVQSADKAVAGEAAERAAPSNTAGSVPLVDQGAVKSGLRPGGC
ncbi:hypothetical protein QYE76_065970 [Lolium multiflorum]|uniref:CCHC-type domain-containing protein n=1 Tax=Lolium multiflorum TaxID=4521 RepID=A0AAD8SBY5_LOLMU|nr:hypothetical protein QYE76_065970 [Lolium multiflorum]